MPTTTTPAPAAREARSCWTCGASIPNPRPNQLHCSPATGRPCGRLEARLRGAQDIALAILADTDTARSRRARFNLRRTFIAAVGGDLPEPKIIVDTTTDAERAGGRRHRRWCACCRYELPEVTGRGRPATTCKGGRPCDRLRIRLGEISRFTTAVIDGSDDPEKVRERLLGTAADLAADIY